MYIHHIYTKQNIPALNKFTQPYTPKRCAPFYMLYQHQAETAESSAVYCRVFYHLAECQTLPHSLATSFPRAVGLEEASHGVTQT